MDDRVTIEFVHGGHDAILEFLFGCDADVAQSTLSAKPIPSDPAREASNLAGRSSCEPVKRRN
jgi:hypothetical protein